MTGPIQVREAMSEEQGIVGLLLKDAYHQYSRLMPPDAWQSYVQDIMDVSSRMQESQLLVALLDGRLVGAVTLYLKKSHFLPWPKGWAGIRLLGVHPDLRGRGVGKALMGECVLRARVAGLTAIGLHTTTAMDVARGMYEKMGFVRSPRFDFHPDDQVIVMAYRLDI